MRNEPILEGFDEKPPRQMITKTCAKCHLSKLESEFTRASERKSGLRPYCKKCFNEYMKNYCASRRPRVRALAKRARVKRKIEILSYYSSSSEPTCTRCGFSDIRALSIDHINGGGFQHRKVVGEGISFYTWLKKNDFPSGYQTLCMNCQFIKKAENKEDGQ